MTTAIHTAHQGHEIRCVTYDCTPNNHDDDNHALRCITCHAWANEDPRASAARRERLVEAGRQEPSNDQGALW